MAMREIPKQYVFACDGCSKAVQQPDSHRPKFWGELIVAQDAYDYQGHAVADGTIRRLLCQDCLGKAQRAINSVLGDPDGQR